MSNENFIAHCYLLMVEPEKRLFVGFDHNANPLEIIGVVEGETLVVIHAMKLRKQFYQLLEEQYGA